MIETYLSEGQEIVANINENTIEVDLNEPVIELNLYGAFSVDGLPGAPGEDGDDGASIISGEFVSNDLVFTKDDSNTVIIENALIDLKGEKGDKGDDSIIPGPQGLGITSITKTSTLDLVDTYTITYTDLSTTTFNVTNGEDGTDGDDGVGITSIVKTGTLGLIDTYTVTYTNNSTDTFDVTNGAKGDTGNDGPNNITTSTTTNLTGFLKGNGSVVSVDNSTYLTSIPDNYVLNTGDTMSGKLIIEEPETTVLYAKKTIDTFDCVQHIIAPSTWVDDTTFVKPGYYYVTGDVLNVVSDFLYMGKDTTFTDIHFGINTVMSAGTNRRWEYSVDNYDTAEVTATLATTVMTVTGVTSGKIYIGDTFVSESVTRTITGFGTGTGGVGTYNFTPTGGTVGSATYTTNGGWKTLPITTDGTNQWANTGIVNFTAPNDWTVKNIVGAVTYNGYWVRVGTESGTFSTEPTLSMCIPSATEPNSVVEMYSGDNTVPDFIIDKKGSIAMGYTDPTNLYKLRVNGPISGTALVSGSTITASTSIALATTSTHTVTATGLAHVGGPILNGPASTVLLPSQNSPIIRFSSQAWNNYITKINAMDIYVNPDNYPITRSRMAFKNTTVDGNADVSELMNITSDGTLNVIGLAQPRDHVFDCVMQEVTSVFTNITQLVSNFGNVTGDVLNASTGSGDAVYFGKRDPFSSIQIVIGTAKSTGGTFVWEYYDTDTTWKTLTVTDGTVNGALGTLSKSGTVDITVPATWGQTSIGTTTAMVGPLYYCRVRCSAGSFTTEPTLVLALPNTSELITGEIFSDTTFDVGTTKWEVTGGWAYTTGDYTFTWSSGTTTGTLTQTSANFLNPAKANTWYRFRYVVGVASADTTNAWIGTEFAETNTYFRTNSTSEIDVFFKTNSNPGNFVIYATSTATSAFRLDGVSLTELKDGNLCITGTACLPTTATPLIKTDTQTPTDLTITTGASKTLMLSTPVYNDLYTGVASAKIPASNYPDWSTFTTNTSAYTFKVNDYADLTTIEILHDYKEGTNLEVHLHLATNGLNDATARKVKYMVYYTWANPDQGTNQFSGEDSLTAELDIPANQADKSAFYLSLGTITGTNFKIGAQLKFRIKRIAGTGTEPINNPFLGMVGVHYQIDTIGSRTITTK